MHRGPTVLAILTVLLGLTPALAGCARPAPAASQALTVSLEGGPGTLDPTLASQATTFDVLNNVMEGLVRLDGNGVPQQGLASAWKESADGLTYTFTLRRSSWSNGDPVTAQDFVYAWDQALDPRTAAPYRSAFQYLAGAAPLLQLRLPDPKADAAGYQSAVAKIPALLSKLGVQAVGTHTLVVHLASPTPYWLQMAALPPYFPVDETLAKRLGPGKYGSSVADVAFDGPFVVQTWTRRSELDLAANPRYWDRSAVHLGAVHMLEVTEPATEINLWSTGKLDAMLPSIPSTYVSQYQGQPGFQTQVQASTWFLVVNTGDPLLTNLDVRQALSLAIDRQQLATDVVKGNAQPASSLVPPVVHYAPGKLFAPLVSTRLPVTAQASSARQHLAAGLKALGQANLGTLTLQVMNNSAQQTLAQALQAMWQTNLGITVQIRPLDPTADFASMGQGKFQLSLLSWNADYDDPTTFLDLFQGGASLNLTGWRDPVFDHALADAATQTSATARGQDLADAEKEFLAQLPALPLFWTARNWIVRPDVHGLVMYETGPDYSLKGVTVSGASR